MEKIFGWRGLALASCGAFAICGATPLWAQELPELSFLEEDYAYTMATGEPCTTSNAGNCEWTRAVPVRLFSTQNSQPLAEDLSVSLSYMPVNELPREAFEEKDSAGELPATLTIPAGTSPGSDHRIVFTLTEPYRFERFRVGQKMTIRIEPSANYVTDRNRPRTSLFREYGINQRPFAQIAPSHVIVPVGEIVTLDGTESYDVDYDATADAGKFSESMGISSYLWGSSDPSITLLGAGGEDAEECPSCPHPEYSSVRFVAPPLPEGVDRMAYTFTLNVNDALALNSDAAREAVVVIEVIPAPLGSVRFEYPQYTATEGGDSVEIRVLLSGAQAGVEHPVTLSIEHRNGIQAGDYRLSLTPAGAAEDATRPVTLVFAAGVTSRSLFVRALADAEDEGDERLRLSFVTGALPAGIITGTPVTTEVLFTERPLDPLIPLNRVLVGAFDRGAVELVLRGIEQRMKLLACGPLAADAAAPRTQVRALARKVLALTQAASATSAGTAAGRGAALSINAGPARRAASGPVSTLCVPGSPCPRPACGRVAGGVYAGFGTMELSGEVPQNTSTLRYDGDLFTVYAGADARVRNSLFGVALAQTDGELDFRARDASALPDARESAGLAERELRSVHPYVAWRPTPHLLLWAAGGYGEGDYRFAESTPLATRFRTDAELWMTAAGFERALVVGGPWDFALRAKGLWTHSKLDATTLDTGQSFPGLDTRTRRARAEGEFGRNLLTSEGGLVRPYFTTSLRYDAGDAGEDVAVEVGGGVEVRLLHEGLNLNIGGRKQAGEREVNEDTIFGTLHLDLGADGQGFVFTLRYGAPGEDRALWSRTGFGDAEFSSERFAPPALEAHAAYRWAARARSTGGALTAFATLGAASRSVNYGLGLRFSEDALALSLAAELRRSRCCAAPERRISLSANLGF